LKITNTNKSNNNIVTHVMEIEDIKNREIPTFVSSIHKNIFNKIHFWFQFINSRILQKQKLSLFFFLPEYINGIVKRNFFIRSLHKFNINKFTLFSHDHFDKFVTQMNFLKQPFFFDFFFAPEKIDHIFSL